MGREDNFAGNSRSGFVESHAFFLHSIANSFEDGKRAVSFVQMKDARRDAHRFQRAKTANSQKQLLPDAHAAVPTVQTRRQVPIFRGISFDIRIQQKEVDSARPSRATLCARIEPSARFDLDRHGLAVRANRRLHRRLIDVGLEVLFPLPTVAIEPLAEISLAIEKSDADQRNPEVGRALDVISRKDAKAARIDRHRFMQAELRGEIGYRAGPQGPA